MRKADEGNKQIDKKHIHKGFYVIYPADEKIRMYINAIRVFADPEHRTEAHITIRGPYIRQLSKNKIESFSKIIDGEEIKIIGIGNFFDSNQNTVYFKCEKNQDVEKIWKKSTYPDYNPHITIYNGSDRKFAVELFETLSKNFKEFSYKIKELTWLEPKNKEKLNLFYLAGIVNFDELSKMVDYKINDLSINIIPENQRLKFIHILCKHLYTLK